MRRCHHLLQPEQDIGPGRLLGEDIEGSTGNLPGFDRRLEIGFDDQLAPRTVDQANAAPGPGQRLRVDHPPGPVGQRRVERDEVRPRQQFVDLDLLDVEVAGPVIGQIGIVGDHLHLQPVRPVGDDRADVAATNNAEGLAGQFDPDETGFFPFAGLGRAVGRRNLAGESEHHGNGVFGGGNRVAVRRVHDHDPALGRRGEIDIVDADAGPADHLEALCFRDQFNRCLGCRADRKPVVAGDAALELASTESGSQIGLDPPGAENLDGARAQIVGDQYSKHGAPRPGIGFVIRRYRPASQRRPSRARAATPPDPRFLR